MMNKVPSRQLMNRCFLVLFVTIAAGIALNYYGPFKIEESILLLFRRSNDISQLSGPAWVQSIWSVISWSGNTLPRVITALLGIIIFLLFRRWKEAFFISGVLLSGFLFSTLIKLWVARPRPEIVPHLDYVKTASFPSGHALNSTLFYLTMVVVIAPLLSKKSYRRVLYIGAIALSLATGISRLALGVHWPTDVIGGWIIAACWVSLWLSFREFYWR